MGKVNKTIVWAGLETLYFTGGHRLARPFLSGVGTILTFHQVCPPRPDGFQPNRSLEITPQFLEQILSGLRAADGHLVARVNLQHAVRVDVRVHAADFAVDRVSQFL